MASISENSFGAKLINAQNLVNMIQGFTGYNPPRTQESIVGMNALLTSITSANNSASSILQQYKSAVSARQIAYKGSSTSIDRLLSPLRGAVDAQYGKKSPEGQSISTIIKSMRATKLVRLPADPSTDSQEKTISQSERSYGSIIQTFNTLIASLQQFNGFNPSNNTLKIASLQASVSKINTLNDSVAQKIQALKTAQTNRKTQYTDLKDRVQRIKSYVKAQYGTASNEYNMIKGLKV
jgi:hypothetical protein